MTPERHARTKEIFLAARALPVEKRLDYIRQACDGDKDLQDNVEELLKYDTEDSSSYDGATGTPHDRNEAPAEPSDAPLPSDTRDFAPGTLIADRYRIVAMLGKGGMGEVYRADDLVLGQTIALKFLPKLFANDPAWLERLRGEVRVARTVTHPHVCRIHDIVEADGDCFITMEYVDGEDLRSLLKRIGRLPQDKALDIARQLCAGLEAAHARNVLHRDLKPANIMLDGRGQVIITDFGLAGLLHEIKVTEIRAGTPAYMAPEQLAGREVTVRSDIYALGLVLYELFTGQPAFRAGTVTEYAALRDSSTPSLPSSIISDLDPVVEKAILRCLEREPQDRPPSVLAVAAALPGGDPLAAALAAGETPSPDMVAAAGQTSRLRSPLAVAGLAGFFLMLVIAILVAPMSHPIPRAEFNKSPEVLAEKARDLLAETVKAPSPDHEAYGLVERMECPFVQDAKGGPEQDTPELGDPDDAPVALWFRGSPTPLVTTNAMNAVFGNAGITLVDPVPTQPGMAAVVLDARARLLALEVTPQLFESASHPAPTADWSVLMARAGLDPQKLRPVEPQMIPRVYADSRQAWKGIHPDDETMAIRVEAAAYEGAPVCFAVLWERQAGDRPSGLMDLVRRKALVEGTRTVLLTVLVLVSLPLAWRNLRQGRSDPRGALRLAGFVLILRLIAWLLQAPHVGQIEIEVGLAKLAIVGALAESMAAWLFYAALEPLVRRFWPQSLIAWTRVLAGQIRDPLVGRNVLMGAALGVFWVLVTRFDWLITSWLGFTPREAFRADEFFTALLGARHAVAFCIDALRLSIYESLFLLLLLVLLRNALRRTLLADIVGILLIAPLLVPRGSHGGVSLIVIGLGGGAVAVYVLTRFGLVPIITAIFVTVLLLRFPLTFNVRMWYADLSLFAILVATAVAMFGFLTARTTGRGTRSSVP